MSEPPLLRPRPRRPFDLTTSPSTTSSSRPSSPPAGLSASDADADTTTFPPSRTRSILNLTSSTLFGIYSGTGFANDREEASTPWGTGAETPIDSKRTSPNPAARFDIDDAWDRNRQRRTSVVQASSSGKPRHATRKKRRGFGDYYAPLVGKNVGLGALGACYGILISHLHDRDQIAPIRVEGIPHHSWAYLAFWAVFAVSFGQLMPWVDRLWEGEQEEETDAAAAYGNGSAGHKRSSSFESRQQRRGSWAPQWYDVVRSIGAFVGIAFAIRKLPWQSTLQLSLTLALVNPAVWYLLDRTPPGFILSTTTALSGTALLLSINPDLIPSPANSAPGRPAGATGNTTLGSNAAGLDQASLVGGLVSQECVGVATWVASVLFVSCICFGNMGRRLW